MMANRRRYLGEIEGFELPGNRAYIAATLAAAYPESERYSLEEVSAFWGVAAYLDMLDLANLKAVLRHRRIRIPALIQDDPYQIGRYLLSRWKEPEFRQLLISIPHLHQERMADMAGRNDPAEMAEMVVDHGFLPGIWALYCGGLGERIEAVVAHLSAEDREYLEHLTVYCRAVMHRYLTEPFLLRSLTMQERKAALRRIKGRALRMRAMRRSIYALDQERRALVSQARQMERQAMAELDRLSIQLEQIKERLAEAERLHAAALAGEAARFARELTGLRGAREALEQEFGQALAERSAWAPCQFLGGLTVAVVGDEGRSASYAALVQSAGGRFVQVSALEKLNRIPDAVAGADVVILVTAQAKHAAEKRLRKAARPDALLLRCPKAGVAAVERVLQGELLPRLLAKGQATTGGELHDRNA